MSSNSPAAANEHHTAMLDQGWANSPWNGTSAIVARSKNSGIVFFRESEAGLRNILIDKIQRVARELDWSVGEFFRQTKTAQWAKKR